MDEKFSLYFPDAITGSAVPGPIQLDEHGEPVKRLVDPPDSEGKTIPGEWIFDGTDTERGIATYRRP